MDENELTKTDYVKMAIVGVGAGFGLVIAAKGWKSLFRDLKDAVNEKIDSWEKEL